MTQYAIPANPVLDLADLFLSPRSTLPAPLDRPGVSLFGYARAALYVGLQKLGLKAGDNVLLPAFICNVIMIPLLKLGVEARFYDLDEGLCVDFDSADSLIDEKTRALLAVNYFGFPQDLYAVQAFCRQRTLFFIEDNAQGFLSAYGNLPLGTFGDISIVSLRKTLPLPNGAALIVNNVAAIARKVTPMSNTAPSSLLRFAVRHGLRNIESRFKARLTANLQTAFSQSLESGRVVDDNSAFDKANPPLSKLVLYLLRRVDVDKLQRERRLAFAFWQEELRKRFSHARMVFSDLRPGTVPYALPLIARDYRLLQHQMYECGVECLPWTRNPAGSQGWKFAERVLLVPLHRLPDTHGSR